MLRDKTPKKIIIYLVAVCIVIGSWVFSGISISNYKHKLGQCRAELESVRIELATATNRQSELADIVEESNAVLCQSVNTVTDLRKQFEAIRVNYQKMESIISEFRNNSNTINYNTGD